MTKAIRRDWQASWYILGLLAALVFLLPIRPEPESLFIPADWDRLVVEEAMEIGWDGDLDIPGVAEGGLFWGPTVLPREVKRAFMEPSVPVILADGDGVAMVGGHEVRLVAIIHPPDLRPQGLVPQSSGEPPTFYDRSLRTLDPLELENNPTLMGFSSPPGSMWLSSGLDLANSTRINFPRLTPHVYLPRIGFLLKSGGVSISELNLRTAETRFHAGRMQLLSLGEGVTLGTVTHSQITQEPMELLMYVRHGATESWEFDVGENGRIAGEHPDFEYIQMQRLSLFRGGAAIANDVDWILQLQRKSATDMRFWTAEALDADGLIVGRAGEFTSSSGVMGGAGATFSPLPIGMKRLRLTRHEEVSLIVFPFDGIPGLYPLDPSTVNLFYHPIPYVLDDGMNSLHERFLHFGGYHLGEVLSFRLWGGPLGMIQPIEYRNKTLGDIIHGQFDGVRPEIRIGQRFKRDDSSMIYRVQHNPSEILPGHLGSIMRTLMWM